MTKPEHIVERLCSYKKRSGVFNPWAEVCDFDKNKNERERRQERLIQHLSIAKPKLILVGEAAGYQGCRYSGVTFTSEKILLNESIPRIQKLEKRITTRKLPFCEPSATIVWGALRKYGLAEHTLLWNTFPFHPMKDGKIHSNRTPTREEIDDGAEILMELLTSYEIQPQIVAVGQKALGMLTKAGIATLTALRHPAFGGANEFRKGLAVIPAKAGIHKYLNKTGFPPSRE